GVGIVAGLLIGLAALLLDALTVLLGGLGVLVARAAALTLALTLTLAAASAAGAGGEQLLGLEEAVGALLRVLDQVRLPLDGDREVVEDLALGVQRGVEVAVLRPLLQREPQLLLGGGVLALLQQRGALGQVRQVGLEPVGELHRAQALHGRRIVLGPVGVQVPHLRDRHRDEAHRQQRE